MIPAARRHRWALALVVAAVTLIHAGLGAWLGEAVAELRPDRAPERLKADFVAEVRLQPAAPSPSLSPPGAAAGTSLGAVARKPRPARRPHPPEAAASAASAVDAAASASAAAEASAAAASAPAAAGSAPDEAARALAAASDARQAGGEPSTALPGAASAPSPAPSSAPSSAPLSAPSPDAVAGAGPPDGERLFGFPWPRSTRIRYSLSGQYRGEVRGSAEVVWLREGTRYQVHVDTLVGPGFAPLLARNISSDGQITPQGLAPRRYDEQSRVAFSSRRRHVTLDEQEVTFTNGEREPRWPGVQDLASQFVQLTWRLIREPSLLTPGRVIELPVAMSKQQRMLVFDVLGEERLSTPLGELPAVHLRPRMPPDAAGKLGGDLLVELWFAPQLEYLPVRLKIAKDEATYVDLVIDRLPQRAAASAPGAAGAGPTAAPPAGSAPAR